MINGRVHDHIQVMKMRSDCYEDGVFHSFLSWRRWRKKGEVVTNCDAFDCYWCIMNLLAQVPTFFKCLRQEILACVTTRNSDNWKQLFHTKNN